jgi:hypothetical protein
MSLSASKTFLWRTAASCLLIFDYFLFTTGNPSITYSIFGGWFEVTLIAAVVVTVSYGYEVVGAGETKRRFVLYLFTIGLFSLLLLAASQYAREFAGARLEAEISSFVKDPNTSKADVSNEGRQLMVEIRNQRYSMERETFIPTFRRMDYLFKTETGTKYRLIMMMSWNGTAQISFRRVEQSMGSDSIDSQN